MSEDLTNQESPETNPMDEEELELSHTDKLVGVFTEPAETFRKMSLTSPKTIDWLIPILLVIIVAALSNFVLMSNPEIKYAAIEKQMEQIEKQLDEAVAEGQMTQEQADQRLEQTREFMENQAGAGMIFQVIGIVVVVFITFFIVAGVFHLIVKAGLKGEGTYNSSMVAYGLPSYISILQLIVMVILGMTMNKLLTGTSVAVFMDMNPQESFAGLLLSKVDPFSIWFYGIVSIAYAKMYKAKNAGKYFITIYGLWIGFSIILYFAAQAVPFLRWFVR
ncbi:MAG: YIP1 family protein [Melioribacteraceae bacterium]|nr:YIP1 family protein [Melioribacteraceae bacterium]